ncbi:MAG: hypothetical protein RIC55_02110 [Pirellulaceae bacterium]
MRFETSQRAMLLAAAILLGVSASVQAQLDTPPPDAALEPFDVKDCTGPAAGKTLCYYCRYELRPVVCIFTRELDDAAKKLIVALDAAVERRRDQRMAAFVVLLGDDTEATERSLRELAAEHRLRHTPLTIYRDSQAKLIDGLGVSPEKTLTIRAWRGGKVVGQHVGESTKSFSAAELVQAVEQVARPAS